MTDPGEVTRILRRAGDGDAEAAERLLALVYEQLRQLARAQMAAERPGVTLQPTALVHEAWLRLVGAPGSGFDGRAEFFAAAGRAMRRILVEQARRRAAGKRGGSKQRIDLSDALVDESALDDVLDVDRALAELEARDPRKGRLVELRYFAGLSNEETAVALGVSVGTVEREWRFTRAILSRALREGRTD